jgi:hypothetical protein
MGLYELAILGDATLAERDLLAATIGELVGEFGLTVGDDVMIHDGGSVSARNKHSAFAAVYFGRGDNQDLDVVQELLRASAPVIPVIGPSAAFEVDIPSVLRALNGMRQRADDTAMSEIAAALLECLGLLRRQRRVFVSYRRTEARSAALQLHDELTARGFDVFLDTHSIRPGDPFQDVLWHRLVDSDVVVMLDTPAYFDSRWTRQEIGRARAKDIQVLRLVWPEHTPSKLTDLSDTMYLDTGALMGADGPIAGATIDAIVLRVERLRSRSIAARAMAITGKFRADVEKIGARVEGVGAHRAISVRLINERRLLAYPVVGIPTADVLHDVAEKSRRTNYRDVPVVVYDHVGIRDTWLDHLTWLDKNLQAVRIIRVSDCGWTLAGWEDAE